MKAVRFEKFGEPAEVLKVVDVPQHRLADGEARVKLQAAAINPSDLGNVAGRFPVTKLPRTPGRDFAGVVVEGPKELIGLEVWGAGGDIGFTRDGSHAEFIDIPLTAVSRRPKNLQPEEAAAAGVPFVTASAALGQAALAQGEWVIVSGAAGAVGSAAVELVHARGAHVIALLKDARERDQLTRKVEAIAQSDRNDLESVVAEATGGKGADIALNGLGASVFPAFLSALAKGGRMVVYSVAFGGRETTLDLFALYRKRLKLAGLDTVALTVSDGAPILSELTPLFESGALTKPRVAATYALDDAVEAYQRATQGAGKVAFKMS